MPKIETTPIQDRYNAIEVLNRVTRIVITPEQLAVSTGGDLEDFAGLEQMRVPADLRIILEKRSHRLLELSGMKSCDESDSPIGARLLLSDMKQVVNRLRRNP